MRRTLVAGLLLFGAGTACGGESGTLDPPPSPASVEGAYAGSWTLHVTARSTGQSSECATAGILDITEHAGTDFSGTFELIGTSSCMRDDLSGHLLEGQLGAGDRVDFTLEVTATEDDEVPPADIFAALIRGTACVVASSSEMVGTLADGQLQAEAQAEFSCVGGMMDAELVLVLERKGN